MVTDDGAAHSRTRARVVIVHDFMESYGGAERVTEEMARAFPDAPVYALLGRGDVARRMGIEDRCRMLLPSPEFALRRYRLATPLLAFLGEFVRLPPADVVLTSSYAFAHHLRSRSGAPQVCFCHSPLRFVWTMNDSYRSHWAPGGARGAAFDAMTRLVRARDRRAAGRVARFLVASPYTGEQVERFYGRSATVIGAPVAVDRFCPAPGGGCDDYFLFSGRLIDPYKRVMETIEAFGRLGLRLIVAGDGPAYSRARRAASSNVEFTGALGDDRLIALMQRCRAAIFPSQDDFGLIPLEVMACGRPVLACASGGANYTVRPGVTGELFSDASASGIERAMRSFRPESYDPAVIREHAMNWSAARFRERLVEAVQDVVSGAPPSGAPPSEASPSAAVIADAGPVTVPPR
jgi:glycosyltransferase involved in cell wall biosynthesis